MYLEDPLCNLLYFERLDLLKVLKSLSNRGLTIVMSFKE